MKLLCILGREDIHFFLSNVFVFSKHEVHKLKLPDIKSVQKTKIATKKITVMRKKQKCILLWL